MRCIIALAIAGESQASLNTRMCRTLLGANLKGFSLLKTRLTLPSSLPRQSLRNNSKSIRQLEQEALDELEQQREAQKKEKKVEQCIETLENRYWTARNRAQ